MVLTLCKPYGFDMVLSKMIFRKFHPRPGIKVPYTNSDEEGIPQPSQNTARNKAPEHVAECLQGVFDDKMVESFSFF